MATSPVLPASPVSRNEDWEQLLTHLPADLDQSAFQGLALLRKRGVPTAAVLLRLMLAYASGLSLQTVAAWAALTQHVNLSAVALTKRFRQADYWLGTLLAHVLLQRAQLRAAQGRPLRLRLVDGTQVTRSQATGSDWRIHLGLDLRTLTLDHTLVTDAHTGESLAHFPVQPGEVVVADRGYATRARFWALAQAGAQVLVRFAWNNLPLQRRDTDTELDLFTLLRTLLPSAVGDWEVQSAPTANVPALSGRLVAMRLPAEAAEHARARMLKSRRKKGGNKRHELDSRTLEASAYLLLFTTVPACLLSCTEIVAVYRLRWQVEIAIKRLKSVMGLAHLTARHDQLCRAVLNAKLLMALLAENVSGLADDFSP